MSNVINFPRLKRAVESETIVPKQNQTRKELESWLYGLTKINPVIKGK